MINLQHTATVSRKMAIEGKGQSKAFQQIATGVRCLILPVDPKDTLQSNLTVGKDYNAIFEIDADIEEGDKLVVSTGVSVFVNGTPAKYQVGGVSHIEAACTTTGM